MYIVSILSKNQDFLESLPQAILNYNAGNLKFYFFSNLEQLNQQAKQSGLPDLLLCDRDIDLKEVWEKNTINKVYLSEKGDSEEEIYIYKNTGQFLMEIQRRISLWENAKGMVGDFVNTEKERKVIWFLDPCEGEWGKECYNNWLETKYRNGKSVLAFDFSRMGILKVGRRQASPHHLSEVLQCWLYKREHPLGSSALRMDSVMNFAVVEGVKHPMDIEMLKPEFIEYCFDRLGTSYEEIAIYSPLHNEAFTKNLLRYTHEIQLISDQPDEYELPLNQIESWLKEINPRVNIMLFHSRNDPNRRVMLQQHMIETAFEKGRKQ